MRLPHHLVRSDSGIFHFRQKVPADLQERLGRRVIKISLRTRNARQALIYSYELSLRYAQAFAESRARPMPKDPPSIDDAKKAFQQGVAREYELIVDPTSRGVTMRTDGTPQDHANAMLALENIGRIVPSMIVQAPRETPPAVSVPAAPPSAPSLTLGEAVEGYEKTVLNAKSRRSQSKARAAIEMFVQVVGADTPVSSITREQAGRWADSLITKKRVRRTAKNIVSQVAQVFEPLVNRGMLGGMKNPVKGVLPDIRGEKSERRNSGYRIEPFLLDDLKRIFDPANFRHIGKTHTRWASIIGVYSGARVGEVAQLYLQDFVELPTGPVFYITTDHEGQSIKTQNSRRLVPIHPDLVRLGLLERVVRMRADGQTRFFPDVRLDSLAGKGNAISKAFRYYRDQLGIKPQHPNGSVSFHSFRKNVIQELQGSDLPAERRRSLVGHEPGGDVHAVEYMRAWKPEELEEFIPGITWAKWIDFDGLKALLHDA